MKQYLILTICACSLFFTSCREDEIIFPETISQLTEPQKNIGYWGFYMLNEGNMGMNKASIDYFDYTTGAYHLDIYPTRNPNIVKELGDVGNDIDIYGNKLYAVVNSSHYIEIMDAHSAKHIKSIDVPNCRYLAFDNGKAYISSYAGKISIDPNAERGFVAEIDTTSLTLTRKVTVGYQPEEMVIRNGKLYVANSGGYRVPNYDRTVTVVDLTNFEVIKTIDVAINLHRMQIDKRGDIYVSSRGDNGGVVSSKLYVIDSEKDEVKQEINIPITNMTMCGDSLYFHSTESYTPGSSATYGILDTKTKKVVTSNFITDGTDRSIIMPFGLAVNPETREIYVSDAQNHIVSGYLYCFTPNGKLKWKTMAGNIPAHITFVSKK